METVLLKRTGARTIGGGFLSLGWEFFNPYSAQRKEEAAKQTKFPFNKKNWQFPVNLLLSDEVVGFHLQLAKERKKERKEEKARPLNKQYGNRGRSTPRRARDSEERDEDTNKRYSDK